MAWLSLLALTVLLISCSSRKPEADRLEAEAPRVRESENPVPSDDTGGEAEDESDGEASSPVPADPPARSSIDSEAPGAGSAAIGAAPELSDSDSEAAGPGLETDNPNPEAAASEESTQSFSASSSAAIPDRQSEVPEINPLVDEPEAKSEGAGELPNAASEDDFEIDPLVAAVGAEQPIQVSEADSATSEAATAHLMESPGELTITLESIGWIFRSDRSTPGTWRFLGREIIGDSTNFRFLFNEVGRWNFVFERQDISGGESEEVIREVAVSEGDGSIRGSISIATPNPNSDRLPSNADARYAAALSASEAGRADEAIKYYEQDASRNDSAGARARAALVETAAKSGAVGSLLTWIPRYLEENPKPEVLRAALEVFTGEAGYDAQSRAILEKLAESENDYPEWPYRLALLLEKPGEERNLDRAARLYQEVINRWPLSEWRDRSEERLLWLQRHYFRVR